MMKSIVRPTQTMYEYKDLIFLEMPKLYESDDITYNVYKQDSKEMINVAALIMRKANAKIEIMLYTTLDLIYSNHIDFDNDEFYNISSFFKANKNIIKEIYKRVNDIEYHINDDKEIPICCIYKNMFITKESESMYYIYKKRKDKHFIHLAVLEIGNEKIILSNTGYRNPSLYINYNGDLFSDKKILGIIYHNLKPDGLE